MTGPCPACAKPRSENSGWPRHSEEELRQYHPARFDFDQATSGQMFTKDFLGSLEAIVRDSRASVGERFLAWIKLHSWGNFSLCCVDRPDGQPLYQADFALEAGIDRRRVSEAALDLQARGHISMRGPSKLLCPAVAPPRPVIEICPDRSDKISGSPDKFTNTYQDFRAAWMKAHVDEFTELERARAVVKRIQAAMLADYKADKAADKSAALPGQTCQTPRTNSGAIKEESLRVESQSATADRPTGVSPERRAEILAAIPESLCERLRQTPSDILIANIDAGLGSAPAAGLTAKIQHVLKTRPRSIQTLGLLAWRDDKTGMVRGLAVDVGEAWARSVAQQAGQAAAAAARSQEYVEAKLDEPAAETDDQEIARRIVDAHDPTAPGWEWANRIFRPARMEPKSEGRSPGLAAGTA